MFAILSPLSQLVVDTPLPPTDFLQSYISMTVAVLLLAGLQDVLTGGGKTSIDVLFSSSPSAATFGAGCSLATALDEASWPLYSTAVTPQLLAATSRYISSPVEPTISTSAFDEPITSTSTNSFMLLARLAESSRLYEVCQTSGPSLKAWESVVGTACEKKIQDWIVSFKSESAILDEVSVAYELHRS